MKCLVLGGGGFLGSHLCEALLAEGHDVRVFERPGIRTEVKAVEWLEGDFENPADVHHAIFGRDIIFHLISSTLPKTSNDDPVYDIESNVVPTLKLLNSLKGKKAQKIIFISSGGTVYGIPKKCPIPESHSTDPICSYGITKLAIEKYLELYHRMYGIDYRVLRVSNLFGERQRLSSVQGVIPAFLDRALKGESVEIWGDGSAVRDYVYVKDVARAFVAAMKYEGEPRTFNIGSGKGHNLNDLLKEMEHLLKRPIRRAYKEGRAIDVPINVLDISRAKKYLGWQPKTPLRVGLINTINWMREDLPQIIL